MNRKQFIQSQGATCINWTFSWSFINERDRLIIFGAWDTYANGGREVILKEEWRIGQRGRKNSGYDQSREHMRLVEEDGYRLMTFPMQYTEDKDGKVKIEGFTPKAYRKEDYESRRGFGYAVDPNAARPAPTCACRQ